VAEQLPHPEFDGLSHHELSLASAEAVEELMQRLEDVTGTAAPAFDNESGRDWRRVANSWDDGEDIDVSVLEDAVPGFPLADISYQKAAVRQRFLIYRYGDRYRLRKEPPEPDVPLDLDQIGDATARDLELISELVQRLADSK